eukprot:19445-Chlamydomonas_euryale.AAC.1
MEGRCMHVWVSGWVGDKDGGVSGWPGRGEVLKRRQAARSAGAGWVVQLHIDIDVWVERRAKRQPFALCHRSELFRLGGLGCSVTPTHVHTSISSHVCTCVHACTLGFPQDDGVHRLQQRAGASPAIGGRASAAAAAAATTPSPPANISFRQQPYIEQQPLSASDEDIAVALEVVLGPAAASAMPRPAPPAAGGDGGGPPRGFWRASYGDGGLGGMCGAIVTKLLVDLFLTAGPAGSYPL